jgi:hypothetical protein
MCMKMWGDALVVLEGSRRLRWEGAGATWRLAGLWPSEPDRELLDRHLKGGRPLLVVLDREPAVVSALMHEVPRLPEGVIIRSNEADVLDVEVLALDWLPEPLRGQGRTFAAQAAADELTMPRHRVPPLLVDPAPPGSPVRFARRTATCRTLSTSLLDSLLAELFPSGSLAPTLRSSRPSGRRRSVSPSSGRSAASGAAPAPSPDPLVPLASGPEGARYR